MHGQNEVRSRITAEIIDALSDPAKLPPWRKGWTADPNTGHPCNAASRRAYTGINPLLLEMAARRHRFRSRWWATFRQWEGLGGRVTKRPAGVPPGRWGTHIVFCKPVPRRAAGDDGEEAGGIFWVIRSYTVFNLDQVEGPFARLRPGTASPAYDGAARRHEHADAVIAATGADIRHGGDRAFYSFSADFIQMPDHSRFDCPEGYYQTVGHELCHWTEHPSRLNWDRSRPENSYAMGELIAELGGCYLMGELGLPTGEGVENHAAYLQAWLAGMRNDQRFIFRAAAQASRAVDHILAYSRPGDAAPTDDVALVG